MKDIEGSNDKITPTPLSDKPLNPNAPEFNPKRSWAPAWQCTSRMVGRPWPIPTWTHWGGEVAAPVGPAVYGQYMPTNTHMEQPPLHTTTQPQMMHAPPPTLLSPPAGAPSDRVEEPEKRSVSETGVTFLRSADTSKTVMFSKDVVIKHHVFGAMTYGDQEVKSLRKNSRGSQQGQTKSKAKPEKGSGAKPSEKAVEPKPVKTVEVKPVEAKPVEVKKQKTESTPELKISRPKASKPKAEQKAEPKTTEQKTPEQKPAEIKISRPKSSESKTESKTDSKPESKTESKSESKTESKPESKTDSKPEWKTNSKPEWKTNSKPEWKTNSKPEWKTPDTKVESKTESKVEPKAAKPKPAEAKPVEPVKAAKPEPTIEVSISRPKASQTKAFEAKPEPKKTPEVKAPEVKAPVTKAPETKAAEPIKSEPEPTKSEPKISEPKIPEAIKSEPKTVEPKTAESNNTTESIPAETVQAESTEPTEAKEQPRKASDGLDADGKCRDVGSRLKKSGLGGKGKKTAFAERVQKAAQQAEERMKREKMEGTVEPAPTPPPQNAEQIASHMKEPRVDSKVQEKVSEEKPASKAPTKRPAPVNAAAANNIKNGIIKYTVQQLLSYRAKIEVMTNLPQCLQRDPGDVRRYGYHDAFVPASAKPQEGSWRAPVKEKKPPNKDRQVVGILNKWTIEKTAKLFAQLLGIDIDTYEEFYTLIKILVSKAISQHHFLGMYVQIACGIRSTILPKVAEKLEAQDKDIEKKLGSVIYDVLQDTFDELKGKFVENIEGETAEDKEERRTIWKTKLLGIAHFAGELVAVKQLAVRFGPAFMTSCGFEDDLMTEAASVMLQRAGKRMDTATDNVNEEYEKILEQLVAIRDDPSRSSRIRYLIKDILEDRVGGWKKGVASRTLKPMALSELYKHQAPGAGSAATVQQDLEKLEKKKQDKRRAEEGWLSADKKGKKKGSITAVTEPAPVAEKPYGRFGSLQGAAPKKK